MNMTRTANSLLEAASFAAVLGVACGGTSTSNGASARDGNVSGGSGLASTGASAGGSSTNSGTGGSGGSPDQTTSGGGLATLPSDAGGTSSSRFDVGEACPSVGARACASGGIQAVLSCDDKQTWRLSEHCPAGATCDASLASCVTESNVCSSGAGTYCADETALAQCDENGRIVKRSLCPSRKCRKNACLEWDPCNGWATADVKYQSLCDLSCSGQERQCLNTTDDIAYGVWLQSLYFKSPEEQPTCDVAVPSAARWKILDACPDIRAYFLITDNESVNASSYATFELPEQFWLVTTSVQTRPKSWEEEAKLMELACTATPDVIPYRVVFDPDTVAIIATRDPKAPAFWLSIQALWDEPAP